MKGFVFSMKNKKIISALLVFTTVMSSLCYVFAAEEKKVTVSVNDRLIYFVDQDPVISENDNTLIPVRGVFEAMGAKVSWDANERSVYVQAKDNIVRLKLFIDNPIAKKLTLTSITSMDSEDIELSTPPTIMNDRTMIPLRVVSENIGATVDWDGENKHITILTKEYKRFISGNAKEGEELSNKDILKSALPYMYIEADKTQAKVGETITVSLKIANTEKIGGTPSFAGVTGTIYYDMAALESISQHVIVEEKETTDILSAANPEYANDSVKFTSIIYPNSDSAQKPLVDGTLATFKFKVLDENQTEISLSNRAVGWNSDTSVMIDEALYKYKSIEKPEDIYIDITPVVINAQ